MMQNKLSRVGVGAGLTENIANSAQFQVKLPTGAELGNIKNHSHSVLCY